MLRLTTSFRRSGDTLTVLVSSLSFNGAVEFHCGDVMNDTYGWNSIFYQSGHNGAKMVASHEMNSAHQ